MVGKKNLASDSPIGHTKQANAASIKCELFDAESVLHSVALLLRHYKNEIGDDTDHCWYGLSLVLLDVHKAIGRARDRIDTNFRSK